MLQVLTLAALALLPTRQQGEPQQTSLLEAVPARASMAIVVDDFPALWSRARASAWAEVLRAPAFDGVRERLDAAVRAALSQEVVPGELRIDELIDAIHSAALYADELEGDEPTGGACILRLRADRPRARELLQVALESEAEPAEHAGRDVLLSDLDGGERVLATLEWSDGFVLCVSPDREHALDAAVDMARRMEQGSPDGGLAARLGAPTSGTPASLQVHLDLAALAAGQDEEMDAEQREAWSALMLEDLGWLSIQATLGEGVSTDVTTRLELPTSGPLAGWAACARPLPVELTALAPADAVRVGLLGFDARSAWATLREAMGAIGTDADLDAALVAARSTAGIDLEHDLIDQLSGEFAEFVLPQEGAEPDASGDIVTFIVSAVVELYGVPGTMPGSVAVLGLRETGPVEDLVDMLVELGGVSALVEDEQVGAVWMSSLPIPDVPFEPAWAFLDDALVVSLHAAPVRALLAQTAEGAPPSWRADERHRKALAAGAGVFSASVADLAPWIQARYVRPLTWLRGAVTTFQDSFLDADGAQALALLGEVVDGLPDLVDEHLHGTLHSTSSIDGRVLRYHVWTE